MDSSTFFYEPEVSYQKSEKVSAKYQYSKDAYSCYSNNYTIDLCTYKKTKIVRTSEEPITVKVNDLTFQLPPILKHIAQQIEEAKEILNYTDNWDDEGAEATDSSTYEQATRFIVDYAEYVYTRFNTILCAPYIDILRDGSVSVHWETGKNTQLLIIFKKVNDELSFYYAEQSDRKIPLKSAIVPGDPVDETLALWMNIHLV